MTRKKFTHANTMAWYNTGTIFVLLSLFCAAYSQDADSQGTDSLCSSENRWALLIIAETSPNDTARQSVESIEESFRQGLELAGFPKKQIIALTRGKQDPAYKPTLGNIRKLLQWLKQPETRGPLPGLPALRQADEACEVFVYIQMLGISHNAAQYLCPLTEEGTPVLPEQIDGLLSAGEISEAFARSSSERRLLVVNVLSPVVTRGGSSGTTPTREGIDSKALLREVPIPVARAGFGQVIVNDQINVTPGNIDSFTDIFLRGLSGYADSSLQGNRDRHVTLRELTDYLEHYGNMASTGAVKTMLLGHDYPIAVIPESASQSIPPSDTKAILERVGSTMLTLKAGNERTPDYESAVESFMRAAVLANANVVVQVSRGASIHTEKEGRSRRAVQSSDTLRLLKYESGWFQVESGWLRADTVVALNLVGK
jgi:hypothetical protein